MLTFNRREMTVAWQFEMFVLLVLNVGAASGAEQLFTDDVRIKKVSEPNLILEHTANNVSQDWHLIGNQIRFKVSDYTASTEPFSVEAGALSDSLYVGGLSGSTFGNIGFGTNSPRRTLHVKTSGTPTLRFEQSSGTPQTWDIEADNLGFDLLSNPSGANTRPFTVLPDAPTGSLFIGATGSIGMGTVQPNLIGATSTGGQFINVRSNTGAARLVVQGAVGGELNLVHTAGPANQRNLRIRSQGGTTSFHVVNDALTGFTVANALAINMSNGNIGLKVANPTNPLELASGAKCTAGGLWTSVSSRDAKQDIQPITIEQARATVLALQPVSYRYKLEPDEPYVGFIAEDVPELVATNDRKSLAPMDITAVLTKVVQDQERRNDEQQLTLASQSEMLAKQQQLIAQQQELLKTLTKRLANLEQQVGSRDKPTN